MKLQLYKARMGQVSFPTRATFAKVDGKSRIVEPVENAIITDVLGLLVSGFLFFSTDSFLLKLLAGAGAAWMGTGFLTKVVRLSGSPEVRLTTLTIVEAPEAPAPEAPAPPSAMQPEQPLPDVLI